MTYVLTMSCVNVEGLLTKEVIDTGNSIPRDFKRSCRRSFFVFLFQVTTSFNFFSSLSQVTHPGDR